jgi:hypothetical protein
MTDGGASRHLVAYGFQPAQSISFPAPSGFVGPNFVELRVGLVQLHEDSVNNLQFFYIRQRPDSFEDLIRCTFRDLLPPLPFGEPVRTYTTIIRKWWRRRELNPRPKKKNLRSLHA